MSDYVMKGILFMECKGRKYRPIVYLSKSLNETEKKYKIHIRSIIKIIDGNKRIGKLEIFVRKCKAQIQGLNRS